MKKFSEKINEAKIYNSYEEFLIYKKCYQDKNKYWNCDRNLAISEKYQHLFIKNGKLKCKFGVIKGKFTFRANNTKSGNTNEDMLTSLEGMPKEVYDRFGIDWQYRVQSAVGMPQKVGKDVVFRGCGLTSLEGLPSTCEDLLLQSNRFKNMSGLTCSPRGKIDCSYGKLTSLEGIPSKIECVHFHATNNNMLSSIKGIEMINAGSYAFTRDEKLPNWLIDFLWSDSYGELKDKNIYMEILNHIFEHKMTDWIESIDWPEGFLNDNLKKSAKSIGKYKL